MKNEYYLGLDIGTNSVGWAVTDTNYQLCRFRKKDMWGIRLFDTANTAEDRRKNRSNRRRTDRKKLRIDLLQTLFAEELAKVDETFLIRVNESALHLADKSVKEKFPLFIDEHYTDIDFYNAFPTIFHLRKHLIESTEPVDIRLVYLALHNVIKHRGHFLIDGTFSQAQAFRTLLVNFLTALNDTFDIDYTMTDKAMSLFETTLSDKNLKKSEKEEAIFKLFALDKTSLGNEEYKRQSNIIEQVCKFIVGSKGNLSEITTLTDDVEPIKFKFSDENFEKTIQPALKEYSPDVSYCFDLMKALYEWSVLSDILQGGQYLSDAKVAQYNNHKENLQSLRYLLRKYDKKLYNTFFNSLDEKGANYSNYVGHVKKNRKKYDVKICSKENFYTNLRKLLNKLVVSEDDQGLLDKLKDLSKAGLEQTFPLQKTKDNGIIPHQVHEIELNKILENASKYLSFLNQVDEDGFSVKEKIKAIFLYRIPYFVGPLSNRNNKNAWMVRREGQENTYIYPWNIEKVVDYEKSNEAFIERMTNQCTYLFGEDVLPKNSLLYSKYMVLNELNALRIFGELVDVTTKQAIFNDLFCNKAKVTRKALVNYLKKDYEDLSENDLSGFDGDFKASLKSYLDFKKQIFGDAIENHQIKLMAEDIIRWLTIYGDDKKMLKNVIEKKYPNTLTEEQYKKLGGFTYSGWGNFSKTFLSGLKGCNVETGEGYNSILETMWQNNDTIGQVLSSKYSFREEIENFNKNAQSLIDDISYESVVQDLYLSAPSKRAVWQTLQIAEEVKKIMGHEPKRIFIEMARGEDKKKQRTKSRKDQLLELYKACKDDARDWVKEIKERDEREFNSMKLYLYYTQMGRCMYTGEAIDVNSLMIGNSSWDRDHIYPQSKVKDDSIDNRVLVKKTDNNWKSDKLISPQTQEDQADFWRSLLDRKLISKKKYDRLMRKGEFTNDELAGFISRQLVETRQSTKAVADIFRQLYQESKVVLVKAGLVSDFRKNNLHALKSRSVNDYHHAKDAYLNIVVGNVYDAKFTSNPLHWVKENREKSYSLNKIFHFSVYRGKECVWQGLEQELDKHQKKIFKENTGSIVSIRKIINQNNILYTEYTYCGKGKLFDATLLKAGKKPKIPLKKGLSMERYGGYNSAKSAYFTLIQFKNTKGKEYKQIVGIPIYIANRVEHDADAVKNYLISTLNTDHVDILKDKIMKNSLLIAKGFPMRIRGESGDNILLKSNMQLKLDKTNEETVRLIKRYLEKNSRFDISEQFDGLNHERLNQLYDTLMHKMSTIYKNRPANQYGVLEKGRDKFIQELSLVEKVKVLNEILTFLRCDEATTGDLRLIGGRSSGGSIAVKKNTLCKEKLILVNQSITGLYENREVL